MQLIWDEQLIYANSSEADIMLPAEIVRPYPLARIIDVWYWGIRIPLALYPHVAWFLVLGVFQSVM